MVPQRRLPQRESSRQLDVNPYRRNHGQLFLSWAAILQQALRGSIFLHLGSSVFLHFGCLVFLDRIGLVWLNFCSRQTCPCTAQEHGQQHLRFHCCPPLGNFGTSHVPRIVQNWRKARFLIPTSSAVRVSRLSIGDLELLKI